MSRSSGRTLDEMRVVEVKTDFTRYAEGSVLIKVGNTHVLCSASVEPKVPPFLRDKKQGWVTAEYSMLPRSTHTRMIRESSKGKVSGRTQEIQRLIGRSLRSVVDMDKLGERTIWIDCDVIQADGGTRCASITGAFIAMGLAVNKLQQDKVIESNPIKDYVAAISVGMVNNDHCLDLEYEEDSNASVDLNVVKTGAGKYVEIQGTAEQDPFSDEDMATMLKLADDGIKSLIAIQKETIGNLG